jgi:hypothetical protein
MDPERGGTAAQSCRSPFRSFVGQKIVAGPDTVRGLVGHVLSEHRVHRVDAAAVQKPQPAAPPRLR